jgi:hypothetical protein
MLELYFLIVDTTGTETLTSFIDSGSDNGKAVEGSESRKLVFIEWLAFL